MDLKRGLTCTLCALGMLVLILDSSTALAGAVDGVSLCMRTLIPGVFPFFVLSSLVTASLPWGGLVAAGILGGYPVGAKSAAQAYRSGQLSRTEAGKMATLCNCPGPAFLFGVVGQIFSPGRTVLLWVVYLCSVVCLWLVMPGTFILSPVRERFSINDAVSGAVRSMTGVCGWVILMRTLLAVLERWILWLLPLWARTAICGVLEMTNGILMLRGVEEKLRFILAAGMLGFGGICVTMQTLGVTQGLSMKAYFPGKLFQGCVCTVLGSLIITAPLPLPLWGILVVMSVACVVKLRKIENTYGNLRAVGV